MGRALDNAMLNVGLKDVAKGFINAQPCRTSLAHINRSWTQGIGL